MKRARTSNDRGKSLDSLITASQALDTSPAPAAIPAQAPTALVPAPLPLPGPGTKQPCHRNIYKAVNIAALYIAREHQKQLPNPTGEWQLLSATQLSRHPEVLRYYKALTTGKFTGPPVLSKDSFARLVHIYYREIYYSIRRLNDIFLTGYQNQFPTASAPPAQAQFF